MQVQKVCDVLQNEMFGTELCGIVQLLEVPSSLAMAKMAFLVVLE